MWLDKIVFSYHQKMTPFTILNVFIWHNCWLLNCFHYLIKPILTFNRIEGKLWTIISCEQFETKIYIFSLLVCLCNLSPVNVFSHRPAFQSLMVLSADPDSIRPCSGKITTAHTAAVCPCCKQAEICLCHTARSYLYLFQLQRCNHYIRTNVYRSHCHRKQTFN